MYPPNTCEPKPAVAVSGVANFLPFKALTNFSSFHVRIPFLPPFISLKLLSGTYAFLFLP